MCKKALYVVRVKTLPSYVSTLHATKATTTCHPNNIKKTDATFAIN